MALGIYTVQERELLAERAGRYKVLGGRINNHTRARFKVRLSQ